jgi:hypothetical protein
LIGGTITLHKHTWELHIATGHPDVEFGHVRDTLNDPCTICASVTTPDSLVLVSGINTNQYGDALRVPIKLVGGNHIVTSAYYSSASSHGKIVWKRGDD